MEQLYRKESLEKLSAPDQLDQYIKIINPGVWAALIGVAVLLAGICVWGFVGNLETTLRAAAVVRGDQLTCYVPEASAGGVAEGMKIRIDDMAVEAERVTEEPLEVTEDFSPYLLHAGGLNVGDWVYEVTATVDDSFPDGTYSALLTVKNEKAASFLLNPGKS